MQSNVFEDLTNETMSGDEDRVRDDSSGSCVLRVIEEMDSLLAALRVLIRTCEKQRHHRQTHALELSLELVLRRRNYILNVSSSSNTTRLPYDSFPCENCYITYPTCFVISWLEYLLKSVSEVGRNQNNGESCDWVDSSLCNQSCSHRFGVTSLAVNRLVEGALYPLGAPFVAGPTDGPPGLTHQSAAHLLGDLDELKHVRNTLRLVLKTLCTDDRNTSADVALADSVLNLINSRRNFGFDMDCVNDAEVNMCRRQLLNILETYDSRVLTETFDREICDHRGTTQKKLDV